MTMPEDERQAYQAQLAAALAEDERLIPEVLACQARKLAANPPSPECRQAMEAAAAQARAIIMRDASPGETPATSPSNHRQEPLSD